MAIPQMPRYQADDEPIDEPLDKRILQIRDVRKNRLNRVEREKKQAQQKVQEAYEALQTSRWEIAQNIFMFALLEPILETYYLGSGIYTQDLRRWMDETQEIKPRIEEEKKLQNQAIDICLDTQEALLAKQKELKELTLKIEKFNLLEERWGSF